MDARIPVAVALLSAVAVSASAAVPADFARYEVILQRKPFGAPPPAPVVAEQPRPQPPAGPPFYQYYRLVAMIAEGKDDITVGLLRAAPDSAGGQKSFWLGVGDSTDDGILLEEAYYDDISSRDQWIVLRKGEERYRMSMAGDNGPPGGAAPGPDVVASAPASQAPLPGGMPRVARRRESIRHRKVEPPALTGEELEHHLRSYNMDLIRSGGLMGPPLPIELTPEEDAQLVSEGVLPPAE